MASGFTTLTNEHLIRSNIWTKRLKELLLDDLYALKFVKVLTEFPDGTTLNIPSIGDAEIFTFAEGQAVKYNKFDTGNYTFTFDQYVGSGNAISEKFKRDSFYSSEVISSFLPKQHRAIMEAVETRILSKANSGQTASNANTINGADHRWVGGGLNETIIYNDFAKARYALRKANVPSTNLCAIVDPSVTHALMTMTNVVNNMTPMPSNEDMLRNGLVSGLQWKMNIFGFDVYESNYLPRDIAETIGGRTTTTAVANLFFSAAPGDTMPWIGGFRQMPTVYSEFNKDLQQTEYLTVAEYGFQIYRPENMIVVLTDTDQVA